MPLKDTFEGMLPGLTSPAEGVLSIAPNDALDLDKIPRVLMVATVGNVAVVMKDGTSGVLPGLQPGVPYPVRVKRVLASGTTATGIVGLY